MHPPAASAAALLATFTLATSALADNGVTVHTSSLATPEGYILMDDDPTLHIRVSSTLRRSDPGGAAENVRVRYIVRYLPQGGGPPVAGGSHLVVHPNIAPVSNQLIADDVFSFPASLLTDLTEYDIQVSISHDDGTGTFVADETPNSIQRIGHFQTRMDFGADRLVRISGFAVPPVWLPATKHWRVEVSGGELFPLGTPVGTSIATPDIEVDLDAFGEMDVVNGQLRVFAPPTVDLAGFEADYGLTLIGTAAITTNSICFDLPPGVGWRGAAGGLLGRELCSAAGLDIPLNAADLLPAAPFGAAFTGAAPEIAADAFPLLFGAASWTYEPATGAVVVPVPGNVRFSGAVAYTQFQAQTGAAPLSNAGLWRSVAPTAAGPLSITAGPAGGISVDLQLLPAATGFPTHFPRGSVTHAGGSARIVNSRVVPGTSQLIGATAAVAYSRQCPPCPGEDFPAPFTLAVLSLTAGTLPISPSGGLNGVGLPNPTTLRIGTASGGTDAVHDVATFAAAAYQMPGGMILSEDGQGADDPGEPPASFNPARGLLTPLDRITSAPYHPGGLGFQAGFGNEAGITFREADAVAPTITSRIGGGSVSYAPAPWFRGYGRQSGFTGIVQADPGDVPPLITVFGYAVALDDFGWSYLSNNAVASITGGDLDVPFPSQFSLQLLEMGISCCGDPTGFDLDPSDLDKELAYWGPAPFTIRGGGFDTGAECPNECGSAPGLLALSIDAPVPGTAGTHGGTIYPLSDGQLTDGNEANGRESYLHLGPVEIRGYATLPLGRAHFNKQDTAPLPPVGFQYFPAAMDVSYFEDIEGVVMTNPSLDANEGIHFRDGWQGPGGTTFFTDPDFDPEHAGFDTALATIQEYRTGEAYHPHARRDWFGGTFDYPVRFFDFGASSHFRSTSDAPTPLVVGALPGRITLLTGDVADLNFGAEFEALPKLTLSNLAGLGIDAGTGLLDGAIGQLLDDAEALVTTIANTAATNTQTMLNGTVTTAAATIAINVVGLARLDATTVPPANLADFLSTIDLALAPAATAPALAAINGPANTATSWIGSTREQIVTLRNQLADVRGSLLTEEAMEQLLTAMVAAVPNVAVDEQLVEEIWVEMLGTGPADSALKLLQDRADELLAVLDELVLALEDGGDLVVEAQTAANNLVNAAAANISNLDNQIYNYLVGTLYEDPAGYSDAELIAAVSAMIRDSVLGLDAVSALHSVARNIIHQAGESVRGLVAAILDFANGAAKTLAAAVLFIPDAPLRAVQGFGTHFLTGGLDGYAQTAGDDMVKLRLDGRLGIHLPTQIEFAGYLEYRHLTSQGGAFCDNPGGVRTHELLVGASGGYSKFMSKARKLSVDAKFSFSDEVTPTGFAGSLTLLDGGFSLGGLNAHKGSLHMAVGQQDFYLAGGLNSEMNRIGIAFTGGFFGGRTCSSAPLSWLPGEPEDHYDGFLPYTDGFAGMVLYGEGAANVFGRTCLARLRVGGGAGWYWQTPLDGSADGTWGARLKGTASGELLCIINGKGEVVLDGGKEGLAGRATISRRTLWGGTKSRSVNVDYSRGDGFSFRR